MLYSINRTSDWAENSIPSEGASEFHLFAITTSSAIFRRVYAIENTVTHVVTMYTESVTFNLAGTKVWAQTSKVVPDAQVNSDWSASTGISSILNKPSIPSTYTDVGAASAAHSHTYDEVGAPSAAQLSIGMEYDNQPHKIVGWDHVVTEDVSGFLMYVDRTANEYYIPDGGML